MHPAFSVIVFTTLSGTGFGLWFWLALRIALGDRAQWFDGLGWALGLIAGGALVAAGVIALALASGQTGAGMARIFAVAQCLDVA